jgi:hypothetical protein
MRRTNRRRAAIAVFLALCAPTVGSAAVTIGGDVSAPGGLPIACDPSSPQPCELAQITLAGGQTAAPFNGVVVRWRIAGSTGPFALRVVRPAGSDFTFVSSSAPETAAGSGVDTFATRQPIRAGDYVGIEASSTAEVGVSETGTTRDSVAIWRFMPRPNGPTTRVRAERLDPL